MDPPDWVHFPFPPNLLLSAIGYNDSNRVISSLPENIKEVVLARYEVFLTRIIGKMHGSRIIFIAGSTIISLRLIEVISEGMIKNDGTQENCLHFGTISRTSS